MKIFDLLKQQGLFSNDIKAMVKNNQILLNWMPVTENLDLNVQMDKELNPIAIDCGDFIFKLIKGIYKFTDS